MKRALRVLFREKAFTSFAVLTLALGIGAVTTVFSVVDGVLLQPLAYKDPGRLYAVAEFAPQLAETIPELPVNANHFESWMSQCQSCESGALLRSTSFNLTGAGEPERIDGIQTTWRLFEVLGVQARLGRTFLESEDQPADNKYVVIADSLWRRRLSADPNVVGKSIRLFDEPHVIVGVLPPDFRFPTRDQLGAMQKLPERAEIFKPRGINWAKQGPVGNFNYACLLRLRPDATPQQAESEITAAIAYAGREMKIDLKALLTPLHERITGGSRDALWLLFGAVGAVLLIVCVNLGNLMLVRASSRTRDAAIRRALGAGAGQLFRATLIESLLIALIGGVVGVMLAYAGVRILVGTAPIDLPRLGEIGVDVTTLLFAFVVSAGCGLLCGLWPALRASRSQPADALRAGSRSATQERGKLRAREWLVGFEVALSTVLLVVAGLLGVSFLEVVNADRGFDVERILTAELTLPNSRYKDSDQRAAFHQRMLDKLRGLPGLKSAALVSSLPLREQNWGDLISKEGETRPLAERPVAYFRYVSPDYFHTMGIALRSGRTVAESDRSRRVAVMSESAARTTWPGENAIGKRIEEAGREHKGWIEVIGVVADVRSESLEEKPPMMVYVPYWDGPYWQGSVRGGATFLVRTAYDPLAMAGAFRRAVRDLDAELPLANVLTMKEIVSESVGGRRFQTLLATVFAVSALLLACLGIYGVISYAVARRTNEMGIRMAIGARSSHVAAMVLRQGMRPVVAGLVVGVLAALSGGELLRSLVFGIGTRDPSTIVVVTSILLVVAAAACWIPARRASRIDPASALRYE